MWMVELNIVGRTYVHYLPWRRRLTVSSRGFAWRPALMRPSRAA